MKGFAPITCVAVAIVVSGVPPNARADNWVRLYPREWEATLDFDGYRRRGDSSTTTDLDLQESIRVKQEGYSLDPRISTFAADVEFILEQGKFSGPSGSDSTGGTVANYNLSTSLLQGTLSPIAFAGQASRNSGTLDAGFGSRNEFVNQTRNATFYYRNPYFPSWLGYSEKVDDSTFISGTGSTSETANVLRTLGLHGRSRKLELSLEHDWFADQASLTDRDYEESRLRANHYLRWGRGSNLDSRITYWDRTGYRARKKLDIDESAKLRHSSKLSSFYTYQFGYLEQDTETLSNAASIGATHQLYKNLNTSLTFSGSLVDSDISTEKQYDSKLRFDYRKENLVRGGGDVTAGFGIGYGITDRNSSGGQLDAVDESQTVPTNGIVLLNERFIDITTIVVTNLAGSITYSEGPDYTVITAGGDRTELHIVAGGQIAIAQTILIDYKYQSLPTQKLSRVPYDFSVGIDFGWINVYQRISGEEQSLISGQDASALNSRRDIATGVEIRWQRPSTKVTFGAESRFLNSAGFSSNSFTFRQSLVHEFSALTSLTASTAENFQNSDGRAVELYTANLTVNWRPLRGLAVKPYLNAWMRNSEPAPEDSAEATEDIYVRGGVDVRWRIRRIDLSVRYSRDYRTGTQSDSVEDRLMFTLTRKF